MPGRSALEVRAARAFTLKDYPRAIAALNDLLALAGDDSHTLYLLALCHARQSDDAEAIDFGSRALRSDPSHMESLKLLARLHFQRGEGRDARAYVRRALALEAEVAREAPARDGWLARLAAAIGAQRRDSRLPLNRREHREWLIWAEAFMAEPPTGSS